jgi:hypothetical protein
MIHRNLLNRSPRQTLNSLLLGKRIYNEYLGEELSPAEFHLEICRENQYSCLAV